MESRGSLCLGGSEIGPVRVEWAGVHFALSLRLVLALWLLAVGSSLMWCPSVLALPASEEWTSNVASTSATLNAMINPEGSATSYDFEYGISESYGTRIPEPEGEVGHGTTAVAVEAHLQDLQPHTTYHFRVVASSEGVTDRGVDNTFTTQSAEEEMVLPDNRVWELVSPATKDGALIPPIVEGGGLVQAAEDGDAITYLSVGVAKSAREQEEPPAGNANETQVLSVRNRNGDWSSRDIATPHAVSTGISIGHGQEYRWFSPELSVGLVEPFGSGEAGSEAAGAVPLSPGASEKTIYVRANAPLPSESGSSGQAVYHEAGTEGGYLPVVTACPPEGEKCKPEVEARANAPPGTKFGGQIDFLGATADLSHVVLSSVVPLTAKAMEGGPQLYEWTTGTSPKEQLQIVSVLPDVSPYNGALVSHGAGFGNNTAKNTRNAISSNGSRVIWSYENHLFMRDMTSGQTVQLDAVQGGAGGISEVGAQFQFATNTGSDVFFTDESQLTNNSKAEAGKPDLYECEMVEIVNQLSCSLRDLSVDVAPGQDADVEGVVLDGTDETSYLYFVATGELVSSENKHKEKPKVGTNNLYMLHYDGGKQEWEEPVFISSLADADQRDWGTNNAPTEREPGNLEQVTSRVSPDGKHLVFMSERALTGYDNIDVNSGERDEEVYLYSAPSAATPSGGLVCVSCNPTGERPEGVMDFKGALFDKQKIWERLSVVEERHRWFAGSVPGWTAMELSVANYQSHYLSDDGRVFFDSPDALAPQATNGLMDVYEYEPVGVGGEDGCKTSSPTFSEGSDGCVGLISSGSSSEESVFLDAGGKGSGGEEAEDVFFLTSARLAPEDKDTAFDVYDAHVCSGSAPCSVEAVSPPACTTADSCRLAPSQQLAIFGAPASATFSGAGNAVPLPPTASRCSKGKKLRGDKCVVVKAKSNSKKRKVRKVRDKRRRK
jgi:hypothetical protein